MLNLLRMALEFGHYRILDERPHQDGCANTVRLHFHDVLVVIAERNLVRNTLLFIFFWSQIFNNFFVLCVIYHVFVLSHDHHVPGVLMKEDKLSDGTSAYLDIFLHFALGAVNDLNTSIWETGGQSILLEGNAVEFVLAGQPC
jgi:hypothetical protein